MIPDDCKCAVVCPVYKGSGSKSNVANYRSISVTCVCCKIVESIITHAMLDHLKQNTLLTSSQHGFLSKCSTLTAQLSCYKNWFETLDSGDRIDLITIDYSKAFNIESYSKLLHKISKYGFS